MQAAEKILHVIYYLHTYLLFFGKIENFCGKRKIENMYVRKLFKGGKYSREETNRGNTVHTILAIGDVSDLRFVCRLRSSFFRKVVNN